MKAIIIREEGGPEVLQIAERDDLSPGPEELLIENKATALNRADLLQRMGRYPAPPGSPQDIPGLEFAGEVKAVGERVQLFKPGDRVMGLLGGGGYASQVVTHERLVLAIPENLSFVEAVAIPEAFLTAWDALLQGEAKMGQWVLIHAVASGVGSAALQLANALGLKVIGTSRTEEKLKALTSLGLEHGILTSDEKWEEEILELIPDGVHLVLDFVGANFLKQNFKALRPKGTMVHIGAMGGMKAEVNLGVLLSKRIRMQGTVLRARPIEEKIHLTRSFEQGALPLFREGKLRPVLDRTFGATEIAEAHRYMEQNKNIGKIVVDLESL